MSEDAAAHEREVEALWAEIARRYGAPLGEAERADLRQSVAGLAAIVRELRRVPLSNGEAPLETFAPYRADGGPEA